MSQDEKPQVLAEGKFLRLMKVGRWEYVSRQRASGAVHIMATTSDGRIILVEQERVPVRARTIELPAGIIGDEAAHRDEKVEVCALRELMEETGFHSTEARVVYTGPTAPGLTSEMVNLARIVNAEKTGIGGGVDGEDITVHLVEPAELEQFLAKKKGEGYLIDPRIYLGLHFLRTEV
jgi:ADP-ribose pyrophosphatase